MAFTQERWEKPDIFSPELWFGAEKAMVVLLQE
jgi:hypothetical protein